jgi:hypothetical protein
VRRAFVAAVVLAGAGCAENAILELELDLPAASSVAPDVEWVVVQARSGTPDFSADWAGGGTVPGIPLISTSQTVIVGIEADDGDEITAPLGVRIRYCRDEACGDPRDGNAQETRVTIERAFYEGEYTEIQRDQLMLPALMDCGAGCAPVTLEDIDKCDVGGCRLGDTRNYCDMDDLHFCEQ